MAGSRSACCCCCCSSDGPSVKPGEEKTAATLGRQTHVRYFHFPTLIPRTVTAGSGRPHSSSYVYVFLQISRECRRRGSIIAAWRSHKASGRIDLVRVLTVQTETDAKASCVTQSQDFPTFRGVAQGECEWKQVSYEKRPSWMMLRLSGSPVQN